MLFFLRINHNYFFSSKISSPINVKFKLGIHLFDIDGETLVIN